MLPGFELEDRAVRHCCGVFQHLFRTRAAAQLRSCPGQRLDGELAGLSTPGEPAHAVGYGDAAKA